MALAVAAGSRVTTAALWSVLCVRVCVCARARVRVCVCVCDPEPETLDPKQGHLAAQCPSAPQCLNPEP